VVTTLSIGISVGWVLRNTVFQPQLSLAKYNAIRVGMSRAEVAAVLGPPGDHRTGPTKHSELRAGVDLQWAEGGATSRIEEWDGDSAMLLVGFDESGRVTGKSCFPFVGVPRRHLWEEVEIFVVSLWHRLLG
jgi:hypothetical protein